MTALRLDVQFPDAALKRHFRKVGEVVARKAASAALNRTAAQVRTVSRREAAKLMGVTQSALNSDRRGSSFWLHYAKPDRLVAIVAAKGKPLLLIQFKGTRQTKKGVTSVAWGKRKLYPSTFIATMKSGHRGVFKRAGARRGGVRQVQAGASRGQYYRPQLPIAELYGPSLPQTMAEETLQRMIRLKVNDVLPKELTRAILHFARQAGVA